MSEILKKDDVIRAIDDVMNNREIDSIRNAILAIRDKVIEMEYPYFEPIEVSYAVMPLRGNNEPCQIGDWFDGAKYVVVDTKYKIDTGVYGAYWYSKDGIEE